VCIHIYIYIYIYISKIIVDFSACYSSPDIYNKYGADLCAKHMYIYICQKSFLSFQLVTQVPIFIISITPTFCAKYLYTHIEIIFDFSARYPSPDINKYSADFCAKYVYIHIKNHCWLFSSLLKSRVFMISIEPTCVVIFEFWISPAIDCFCCGYCATAQGLLEWFEVDLSAHPASSSRVFLAVLCCSVLQCVAACCSLLQWFEVDLSAHPASSSRVICQKIYFCISKKSIFVFHRRLIARGVRAGCVTMWCEGGLRNNVVWGRAA